MNPFRYSEPLAPEDLINRDGEAARLLERAAGSHNSRLVAPRRFGKTSLLQRVLFDAAREGWATVYVNFFGAITSDEIASRIDRAYTSQLRGRLADWWRGVRRTLRPTMTVGGGPVPASIAVTGAGPEAPLADRLALPVKLLEQRGIRTLVAFDEFQDVLGAGSRLDAVIRANIERHGDAASYIFAGSQVGMMRELFASKRRAFYAQAGPLDLGPLRDEDTVAYISQRFAARNRSVGSALDPLLDLARGHPQRTMLIAHFLWEHTPAGGEADEQVLAEVVDHLLDVEIRDELRAIWTGMSISQRRVLVAVADNSDSLYSAATRRKVGGARGGSLKTAATSLVDSGELVESRGTRTGYEVVDPLLAYWVRDGRHETA